MSKTKVPDHVKEFLREAGIKKDTHIPPKTIGIVMSTENDIAFMISNGRVSSRMTCNYALVPQDILELEMERACRNAYLTMVQTLNELSKQYKSK